MKTFKKTIEQNKLVIRYDDNAESPREWSNLGYFITIDSRYNSPDDQGGTIFNIVKATKEEAINQKDHIRMIKQLLKDEGEKILAIYPIKKYEHSNISYRLGNLISGFDYSNSGFYIVTEKKAKEIRAKKEDFQEIIKNELEAYNKWVNGEVYRFTLYDDNGNFEDDCGGFYDIENIRGNLPDEWKNENLEDYLIFN